MLGLDLDFLYGRGFLSARHLRLSDWVTVESLRMEIPDLTFPFDARGGTDRFRNTRCEVHELRLVVSEAGFDHLLARAMEAIDGFDDLRVRFSDGAAHICTRVRTLGSDTLLTFKVALVPPEPVRDDTVHAIIYDVRGFGPLPLPARQLAVRLVSEVVRAPALELVGVGTAFEVGQTGTTVELRPIRMAMLGLFAPEGWKVPNLAGLRFDGIEIRPGAVSISARTGEAGRSAVSGTSASARAVAAYEARDLLTEADAEMFAGEIGKARDRLTELRKRFGLHAAIVDALLDTLVCTAEGGSVAEAEGLVAELLRADPDDLRARAAAPAIALLRGNIDGALAAYTELAELMGSRGEKDDQIACLVAAAMVQRRTDIRAAIDLLRQVVRLDPRNRLALQNLRQLMATEDEVDGLIDVLQRLLPATTARDELIAVYLELATLTMQRRRDLEQARVYLERALQLEPDHEGALVSLAESYELDDNPLRAIKALGAAARVCQNRGEQGRGAGHHFRCARLWMALGDPAAAMIACQQGLELSPDDPGALRLAAEVSAEVGDTSRATVHLDRLIPLAEARVESAEDPEAARLEAAEIHRLAARVAERQDRPETAAAHHRKALAHAGRTSADDGSEDPSFAYLESHVRQVGKPEELIDLFRRQLDRPSLRQKLRARYHRELATTYEVALGLETEATDHATKALELDPNDDQARDAAVRLLTRRDKSLELLELLETLADRVEDRARRGAILHRMGLVRRDALPDPVEVVQIFRRAQAECPTDPRIAQSLADAEVELLTEHSEHAGDPNAALDALERLADLTNDQRARAGALERAARIAQEVLGSPSRADGYLSRARQRSPRRAPSDSSLVESVSRPARTRQRPARRADRARPEPPPDGPLPLLATEDRPRRRPDDLGAMAASLSGPASTGEKLAPGLGAAYAHLAAERPSTKRARRNDPPSGGLGELAASLAGRPDDTHDTVRRPAKHRPSGVETFRAEMAEVITQRPKLEDTRPLLDELRRRPDAKTRQDRSGPGRDQVIARIEDARAGDSEDFPIALEELLATDLDDEVRARVQRELGLHLYYELEDPARAGKHLEAAMGSSGRDTEADSDLLSALEGIYEDLGDTEGLLRVYRAKMKAATDQGMIAVYAVLAGELLWDRLQEGQEARTVLETVLESQPDAEPVLELLARISRERGQLEHATVLLRRLVSTQTPGEYEHQEGLRQLGRLLVQRADESAAPSLSKELRLEAIEVYRKLLDDIRGDTEAMATLKRLYEAAGLPKEAIGLLGRELELLLASDPGTFSDGPDPEKLEVVGYSDALAIPISQIFADAGRCAATGADLPRAVALFDAALKIWPENADAIADKLEALRAAPEKNAMARELAESLRQMADLMLDPIDRYSHLLEAAETYAGMDKSTDRATAIVAEILQATAGAHGAEMEEIAEAARSILARLGDDTQDLPATTQEVPALRLEEQVKADASEAHNLETREIATSAGRDWTREELEAAMPGLATSSQREEQLHTKEVRSVDGDKVDAPQLVKETRAAMPTRGDKADEGADSEGSES